MNIHQLYALGLTPKEIGTCEKHMGQHKKQKDCRLWKTIAPAKIPYRGK